MLEAMCDSYSIFDRVLGVVAIGGALAVGYLGVLSVRFFIQDEMRREHKQMEQELDELERKSRKYHV